MHPIIESHPGWRAIEEETARLEREKKAILDAASRVEDEEKRARAEHDAAVDRAIEAGEVPPQFAAPERIDFSSRLHRNLTERDRLRRERRQFLRDHADELLPALEEAALDVIARAAPAIAELERLLPEYAAAARAQEAVHQAAGRRAVVGSGLIDLIHAVGEAPAGVAGP